uniref:Uncharacterized protein n=1 Tax=Heterorhabditis bacteriophora TaxID=37862 RepID=A0A1I7XSX7_HETBA
MKAGFYTTTDRVPRSGWTKMKLQKTSPNRSCTKRRVWSLFGGRQVESSTTTSWILAKPAQQRSIRRKSTKYTKNCSVYVQHWSIEKDQSSSMTVPDHMSPKRLCRNGTTWPTRLYLTQLTRQTSLRPTITFQASRQLPVRGFRQPSSS